MSDVGTIAHRTLSIKDLPSSRNYCFPRALVRVFIELRYRKAKRLHLDFFGRMKNRSTCVWLTIQLGVYLRKISLSPRWMECSSSLEGHAISSFQIPPLVSEIAHLL